MRMDGNKVVNSDVTTTYTSGHEEEADQVTSTTILFSLSNKPGALAGTLARCLIILENNEVDIYHIESRPDKSNSDRFEFIIECDGRGGKPESAVDQLRQLTSDLQVLSSNTGSGSTGSEAHWFPKSIGDLDWFANKILSAGAELDADHPGFKDEVYRSRRKELADLAINYKHGQPIPIIDYKLEEVATWGKVYTEVRKLFPTHACKEFNEIFAILIESCGYREDNIPQLRDISNFLQARTGFTLRPVAGLLAPRDFLAGLAFRVFHSTQYVRHASHPDHTPEPDVCHELIGHVPLFADPAFAEFSQEIGLASLGAPDDYIQKLSTLYWFTVEFGLCRQNGQLKVYGAALLSSFGELQYCLSDKATVEEFSPTKTSVQEYPISEYQPKYYATNSFEEAKAKLRAWAAEIPRNFEVRYDAYTQSVIVLDTNSQMISFINDIKGDMSLLQSSLQRVSG